MYTPRNTCLFGPLESKSQNGILIDSAIFAQLMAKRRYNLQAAPFFPLKLPFPWGNLNSNANMVPWAHLSP